jgi:sulfopyruvate decarboxylase subunit beta
MKRYDVIQAIVSSVSAETPIVCNIGDPCRELYSIADRDTNFYMLGSMGLASSIGLGLALRLRRVRKVVVIDGDGAILMNLGSLATIGRCRPGNLVVVIVDNASYGSTGDQPTATAFACDLSAVAASCGIPFVEATDSLTDFIQSLDEALKRAADSVLVVKTDIQKPDVPLVPLSGPELRERFMKAIRRNET